MSATAALKSASSSHAEAEDINDIIDQDGHLRVSWRLQWRRLDELFVDYHEDLLNGGDTGLHSVMLAYQRKQKQSGRVMASMGRKGYKADLFGVLIGTEREDGRVALGDGGTRYRFLQELDLPGETLVPVLVNHWDAEREIRNYIDLNRERASLSQTDWFVARKKVGDKEAVEIDEILVDESGQGVGHGGRHGSWQAVSMLQKVHRDGYLRQTVIVLRKLNWLDMPRGRSQGIIGGVAKLLMRGATNARIMETWSHHTPAKVFESAREYLRAGQSRAVASAIAIHLGNLYNHKLRSKRLRLDDLISKTEEDIESDDER